MTNIISVGCEVAEIYRSYSSIHDALFGVTSFRQVIATMSGRTTTKYRKYCQDLKELRVRLSELSTAVPTADIGAAEYQAAQLRVPMSEYVAALNSAIVSLHEMYTQLVENEDAYCTTPESGKSAFNQAKIRYDRVLLRLEQKGSRLNQLFSRF